jgi:hypothetical protein
METAKTCVMVLALLLLDLPGGTAAAQNQPKRDDSATFRLDYSFPVRSGAEPLDFRVELDKENAVSGVLVFRRGQSEPLQKIFACSKPMNECLTAGERDVELLKHADLNFDGFQDLELIQFFANRFARSVYCIYLWDPKLERFRYTSEVPDIDPVAHPETQTITAHIDWPAGGWSDSTYRWRAGKAELIEENGRRGAERGNCGTDYCSRLIAGKMVITAEQPAPCGGSVSPLRCPSTPPTRTTRRTGRKD